MSTSDAAGEILQSELEQLQHQSSLQMDQVAKMLAIPSSKEEATSTDSSNGGLPSEGDAESVDSESMPDHDKTMGATTDKDYIDAKLAAATAQLIGDIKAANAIADGRLAVLEAKTDGRMASIESKMDANFARFDATLQKGMADTVKWVAGTVLALGVIGISLMTFLLNNVASKAAAPAQVIVNAQPAPATAASSAAAAKP